MPTSYNRIAGQSVERLAVLSDGVFAMAMTLLVLDLRAPAAEAIHTERDLLHALTPVALLCVFNTYWSLGFIVVVQLNYVLAPRIGFLARL
jgi:uncharacterized membrane protein